MGSLRSIGRNGTVTGLAAIGFLNAITFQIDNAIGEYGIAGAFTNTFGISAIVWLAAFVAVTEVGREPDRPLRPGEARLFLGLAILFLLPLKYVSWLGVTALAVHILAGARPGSAARRGGWVLLAITFPMFWSKLLFSTFSALLLQADAILVSTVLGLPRTGNVITLADGTSHLWIAAGCSSLANVSLTVLGYTLFLQMHRGRNAPGLPWAALCCGLIVALNVGRISLIGLYPAHYDLIHGAVGASIASWLMVAVVFGTLSYGARRVA